MRLFDKQARRERKLERLRLRLEDEFHDLDKWSFGDRPSDMDARRRRIKSLIVQIEKLGGDVLESYEAQHHSIVAEALPEVFEWRPAYPANGWEIVRIVTAE